MLDDIGNYAAFLINLVENPLDWQEQGPVSGEGRECTGMLANQKQWGRSNKARWELSDVLRDVGRWSHPPKIWNEIPRSSHYLRRIKNVKCLFCNFTLYNIVHFVILFITFVFFFTKPSSASQTMLDTFNQTILIVWFQSKTFILIFNMYKGRRICLNGTKICCTLGMNNLMNHTLTSQFIFYIKWVKI